MIVFRIVDVLEPLTYNLSITHSEANASSAFSLHVKVTFHEKLVPDEDHLSSSHSLSNISFFQQSDGLHALSVLLEQFPRTDDSFRLSITTHTTVDLGGQDIIRSLVNVDYYSAPDLTNCTRRKYALPVAAFRGSCAPNFTALATALNSFDTTIVAKRLFPGQSIVLRVSSVVRVAGRHDMLLSIAMEHLSLSDVNASDVWRVIDVKAVSMK